MKFIFQSINVSPAIWAVIILSLICAIGLALGKIHFRGVKLGVTFVFFMGILAGTLGLSIDHSMLNYAESFGLILFVYALGLQVGPGFVSSFKSGGTTLNLLSLGVIFLGTILAVLLYYFTPIDLPNMVGILCGATTNTPALGAAQQVLQQSNLSDINAALSCAITYPLGMVGVIFALILLKLVFKRSLANCSDAVDNTYIASFYVFNPAIFGQELGKLNLGKEKFVVSRLWRNGDVLLPNADTILEKGDRILVITSRKSITQLTILFGKLDDKNWNKPHVNWNKIDSKLVSRRILITSSNMNGRHLGSLHLREQFGVNISRVHRSGINLVATPDLVLRIGDRVTVIGENEAIKKVQKQLGNAVKHLDEPNLVSIFTGIFLGLILGIIPISIPGISTPVQFGLAGGPIIVGILIGAYGPRLHMLTYTTASASLMLRSMGLSLYLACLGLDAGKDFVNVIMQPASLGYIGYGFLLTIIPIVIMAFVSIKILKRDFSSTAGMLCGAMANPIALDYTNDTLPGDKASVAYATVYPLGMFVRVIIAQLVVMILV